MEIIKYLFRRGSQISRAHGRGDILSSDLAETFHLNRADKGYQNIDLRIPCARDHERGQKQKKGFKKHHNLPPVQLTVFPEPCTYPLDKENAKGKCRDGKQIVETFPDMALRNIESEQNNVSCLCIGKNLSPGHIGINIKKTSGHRQ